MYKCSTRILTVVVLLLMAACSKQKESTNTSGIIRNPEYGKWQDREQPPIHFNLMQTFGSEDDSNGFMFASSYNIIGPVADRSGNIYMLDQKRSRLLSFDPAGVLRWQTGQEGKGPGDFQRPRGLAINDTSLFLGNMQGSRIDQYDLEGRFVRSMPLSAEDLPFAKVEGFLDNGLLVTSSTLWGALGSRISVFDVADTLKKVYQFDIQVLKDLDIGQGISGSFSISILDSLIVPGNFQNYAINFYTMNGNNIKTITRNFHKLVRPGIVNSGSHNGISMMGGLNAPIKLSDGYLLTKLSWPANVSDPDDYAKRRLNDNASRPHYSSSLDLYDSTGTLLYSFEGQDQQIANIGNIVYVDSKGFLYTKSNNPFPQIRKYRVTIEG